jgi:erythronate-4-phosphate dehydrogenase
MLKFVVDQRIPLAHEAFDSFGEVTAVPMNEITAEQVRDADVLIIRSEIKVNRSLLDRSRVKFVGTTTIGTDHLDTDYLRTAGIAFASAPGCNSNSVKEYVVAALLYLSVEKGIPLGGKSIGIVGVGNVGSKVATVARALGMTVRENDPPLARSTGDPRFVTLDELMDCDIVTLHVPLTQTGSDPTFHLFDQRRIGLMKRGAILINTARGAVVETGALRRAITTHHLSHTIIDVWENEPRIDTDLLPLVTLGTPHIAGYSWEGKFNGVRMIRDAVVRHFGFSSSLWNPLRRLNVPGVPMLRVPPSVASVNETLQEVVRQCYDITLDDGNIRRMLTMPTVDQPAYFAQLRSNYRVRREWSNVTVHVPHDRAEFTNGLTQLGFHAIVENER